MLQSEIAVRLFLSTVDARSHLANFLAAQNEAQRGVEAPARLFAQVASNAGLELLVIIRQELSENAVYISHLFTNCFKQSEHRRRLLRVFPNDSADIVQE